MCSGMYLSPGCSGWPRLTASGISFVYILLLLAIAAGAAAAWVRGVYPLAIALTILLPLALLLFVLGLRKPHDRRDTARQRSQARRR